jgi:hypothetical protein
MRMEVTGMAGALIDTAAARESVPTLIGRCRKTSGQESVLWEAERACAAS